MCVSLAATKPQADDVPAARFAYDVVHHEEDVSQPAVLANKRVFAFTDAGAPDGIKCDTRGNVYAGCFDGVHVSCERPA